MSKKNLLNEATIRRFMKLANMEPLTSPFVDRLSERQGYDDREDEAESARLGKIADKDVSQAGRRADVRGKFGDRHGGPVTEDAEEERELDATEDELSDMDSEADRERDEMDDMEGEMDAMEDGALPADVRDRVEDALAGALEALAAEIGESLGVELDVEAAPEEAEMEVDVDAEVDLDAPGGDVDMEVDAEAEELLEGIQVVDDNALINEVAKRVTARLVKAMAKK